MLAVAWLGVRRTMIFPRKPLKNGARPRNPRPRRERRTQKISRTGVFPDALAAATAIANAARRRHYRRENLRGIAPIIALALGIAVCVAAMTALAAASADIPPWCTLDGACP
jgi:hypothetical protein